MKQQSTEVSPHDSDLARMEDLIRDLDRGSGTANGLLREHLEEACS